VIGAVPQFAGVPQCLARSPQAAAAPLVYRDGAHLSVRGSMVFVPALRDASRPLANGGQAQR
jgi:hypothetical protein